MKFHGERLFPGGRFDECLNEAMGQASEERDQLIALGFNILHSGTYYDDPRDKIRTLSNLETCIIRYADEQLEVFDKNPIWVEDKKKADKLVGIEVSFDICLERENDSGSSNTVRFGGTIDGLIDQGDKLRLDDNKTASRLDDAWERSFDTSHQVTGYQIGASVMTGRDCYHSRILGIRNQQLGKWEDYLAITPIPRTEDAFEKFFEWAIHANELYTSYIDNVEHAPRYTHSCNRYFRPCSLIPFCTDDPEGRVEQMEGMVDAPLSPTEEALLED